jgi:hypothetical protein
VFGVERYEIVLMISQQFVYFVKSVAYVLVILALQNSELVTFMEEKLANHKNTVLRLTRVSEDIRRDLETTQGVIAKKQEKLSNMPKTFSQLSAMSAALAREIMLLDSSLCAQQLERSIVSEFLSKPCPVLKPAFTFTTSHPTITQYSVAPCPLCCNGFHCFNWIPASCGHTYHPACLFPLILHSKAAPKCKACGEVFSHDWLQTWGLECQSILSSEGSASRETMVVDLKDVYGKYAKRLQQRRELVQTLNEEVHATV